MSKKKRKFGIVDAEVVTDPSLSLRAKGVYAILASYANTDRRCFPKINTLAEFAGVSRRTIERTLKELEDKKYITRNKGVFQLI